MFRLIWIMILLSVHLHAAEDFSRQALAALDYMTTNPATVSGWAQVDRPVYLAKSKTPLGPITATYAAMIKPNKSLSWNLTDNSLTLNTRGALTVYVQGVPVHISKISYSQNGKFNVDIKFGILKNKKGMIESFIEKKMAVILEHKYKAKMQSMFSKLKTLRKQRSFSDANNVFNSIIGLFSEGPPQPGIGLGNALVTGSVSLAFENPRAKTLKINKDYVADIAAGDYTIFSTDFNLQKNRMKFRSLEVTSTKGIIFRPPNKSAASLKAAGISKVKLTEQGWEYEGVTNVEQGLTEVAQLANLIFASGGVSGIGRDPNCDPRWKEIQDYLKKTMGGQLSIFVRKNRKALLNAGVSAEMLNALD